MKTKTLLIGLFFAFFLTLHGKAQKLTQPEIDSINWKIFDFLQAKVEAANSVESEIILIVLQTDSNSNFTNIRLLADDGNRDKVYDALSKFSIKDFAGWTPKYFKNMAIIVPVYGNSYYPKKKNNYADMVFGQMSYAGEGSKIIRQDEKSILLSGILWMPKGKGHGDETKMDR